MRKAFEDIDTEQDGIISLEEFKAAFSQFNYTDEEMNDMFNYLVMIHFVQLRCSFYLHSSDYALSMLFRMQMAVMR